MFTGLVWTGEESIAMGMADHMGSAGHVAREVIGAEAGGGERIVAGSRGPKVLVVEDDDQIRQFVESGLSSLGYRVLTASGGAAALEICRREPDPIDVIVSDVIMSDVSGPRFMAGALRLRPGAAAIYMSAYTEDAVLGLRRGGAESGIPLITKPFEVKSLSRLIRECLSKSENADSSP